jgi:transcriptional regulator
MIDFIKFTLGKITKTSSAEYNKRIIESIYDELESKGFNVHIIAAMINKVLYEELTDKILDRLADREE